MWHDQGYAMLLTKNYMKIQKVYGIGWKLNQLM